MITLELFADIYQFLQTYLSSIIQLVTWVLQGVQATAEGIINLISNLPTVIGDGISILAEVILYPIQATGTTIIDLITTLVAHVVAPLADIDAIGTGFIEMAEVVLTHSLDYTWVALMMTGVGFIVLKRTYHFLKDVEIAGFKL